MLTKFRIFALVRPDNFRNMAENKPFFSVLLPTYNRPKLLPLAIKSVLQQTFEDFELIISNGGLAENANAVALFDDPRIVYVETAQKSGMGDNYQNCLDHASGQYILYFSDDDALLPTALAKVKKVIEQKNTLMVVFWSAFYYDKEDVNSYTQIKQNSMTYVPFTKKLKKVKSQHALEQMSSNYNLLDVVKDPEHFMPFIGNVVWHRSIFENLKLKFPSIFAAIPIDIYFITFILSSIEEYFYLDEPLVVSSKGTNNATASPKLKGNDLRKHYEKQMNGRTLEFVPLKFALPVNLCANAVLNAKNDFANGLSSTDVDWKRYFSKMYEYLLHLGETGTNVADEMKEFRKVLEEQPENFKRDIEIILKKEHQTILPIVKRKMRTMFPRFTTKMRNIINPSKTAETELIWGKKAGFSNFLECAEFLDKNLENLSINLK